MALLWEIHQHNSSHQPIKKKSQVILFISVERYNSVAIITMFKENGRSPGQWLSQWEPRPVHQKAGLIPCPGTYRRQLIEVSLTSDVSLSLFLSYEGPPLTPPTSMAVTMAQGLRRESGLRLHRSCSPHPWMGWRAPSTKRWEPASERPRLQHEDVSACEEGRMVQIGALGASDPDEIM